MSKFDSIEEKVIFEKLYSDKNGSNNNLFGSNTMANTNIQAISENILALDRSKDNLAFRPIFSHRPILGNLIIFIKRIIRKCTKFYIEPICFQQTEFNNISTTVHKQTLTFIGNIASRVNDYEDRLNKFTEKQKEYENKIDAFTEKRKEYEGRLEMLKNDANKSANNMDVVSYSQAGEDCICTYVLRGLGYEPAQCSYLDLGANHAKEISNTYFFYSKGARGVLVEANPDLIPELQFYRKGDVIINKCITPHSGDKVKFYIMNGDGVSTCDEKSVNEIVKINSNLKINKTVEIDTITVNDILEKYFPNAPVIMNIDIEGQEMNILKGIDFDKCRPAVIICEMINYSTKIQYGNNNKEIMDFMLKHDYVEYAFTGINSIFVDKRRERVTL